MALQQFMRAAKANDTTTLETRLREDNTLAVAIDEVGETALHKTAKHGNISAAEILIQVDRTCLEIPSKKEGFTAVHFAVENGHYEMLLMLLNKNANRDPVSKDSRDISTPLHIGTKIGHRSCVKALVEANCCLNKQNKHGKVPLHFAAMVGDVEMVECLVDAGCDKDATDNFGCSALHFASEGGHMAVVELLARPPLILDPTILNKNNQTAEQLASQAGYRKVVGLLKEYKKNYQDWKLQLSSTVPISKIKLYVCGDTEVGKSALLETLPKGFLTFRSYSSRDKTPVTVQASSFNGSVGIDIQDVSIDSDSWFSAWDMGGTMSYKIGIEYLLSTLNAMFIVVVSLQSDAEEIKRQIDKWLSLIRTCSLADALMKDTRLSAIHKPTVLLVLSHSDLAGEATQQMGVVAVRAAASPFTDEVDVLGDIKVFCVNCTATSNQMSQLKRVISQKHQEITKRHPPVPLFCEVLADFVSESVSKERIAPVLRLTDLGSLVAKQINPLVTREHLLQALSVLSMAGRVVYTKWSASPSHWVTLDPDWLCNKLFKAVYLAGCSQLSKLNPDERGYVAMEDLKDQFPEMNREQVSKILEDFGLAYKQKCDHCGSTRLEFPSLISEEYKKGSELWQQQEDLPLYTGRRIKCKGIGNVFLPSLFPKLQVVARKAYGGDIPVWHNGFIIPYSSKVSIQALVELHADGINISVRGPAFSSEKCLEHLDTVWRLLHNTIKQTCPVVHLEVCVLSVRDLQAHVDVVQSYSLTDVIQAERKEEMLSYALGVEESPVDLLYCGSGEISQSLKKELSMPAWYIPPEVLAEIEATFRHPVVRDPNAKSDWMRLAEELGLEREIGILAMRPKDALGLVLERWTTRPQCSVRKLVQALHEVGRDDVAAVITRQLPTFQ